MNKTFMSGYYQGVVEVAIATIHDFLVDDLHADVRLVSRYINCDADQLETAQAKILAGAFAKK